MRKTPLEKFSVFYEENKKKLFMESGVNHPLYYKKARVWIDSQCDVESQEFAEDIIKYTRYISFNEFIKRLKVVCTAFVNNYSKEKDSIFILILPFKLNKSNLWVSLLAYPHLRSLVQYIRYNITDVYNEKMNHKSPFYGKKIICILCDDCAYTGHQISFIAKLDNTGIDYAGKTGPPPETDKKWMEWYKNTNEEAGKVIKKINISEFSVNIIIPFMTSLARKRLHKLHYVKIPHKCEILPIFNQHVNTNNIPRHIINEFKQTFQYHKEISAVYFDHKIADSVSTFHKIYLLAPIFNCVVNNMSMTFIESCPQIKIPDNINIYEYYINLEKIVKNTCPPAFYKKIKYTFEGKSIDSNVYVHTLFGTSNMV